MEENKRHLSLPANYVTLAQLQERWLQRNQQPPPLEPQQQHEHQPQEKKELKQYQGDSYQSHATASFDSEGIDRDGDVNLEGKGSKEWKPKVKSEWKQVRVDERGTKFEQVKEEKEKKEVNNESHREDLHQQCLRAVRAFARKQSSVNHRNCWKFRGHSGTDAEKQHNDTDRGTGGGDAYLEGKGNCEQKKNRTNAETEIEDGESKMNAIAKPKPLVKNRKTEMEEENLKKQRDKMNNAKKEKVKIISSESNKYQIGGGSRMEEVKQKFRGLGFRGTDGDFNYTQPRRGSDGGSNYGNDHGYGNKNFGQGKRGEKMVWVRKADNIGKTED